MLETISIVGPEKLRLNAIGLVINAPREFQISGEHLLKNRRCILLNNEGPGIDDLRQSDFHVS